MPQLEVLEVTYSNNGKMTGAELLHFVQSCAELKELDLKLPRITDITDDLMEEIARSMRSITVLKISSSNTVPLTFRSLHALGRHCRKLSHLELCCAPAWDANASVEPGLFPQLSRLKIQPGSDGTSRLEDRQDSLQSLADCIVGLGPELREFYIDNPHKAEEELLELLGPDVDGTDYNWPISP